MLKVLVMIFTGIIVSFYYFPFEFSFLPGMNTKMGLAVVGIFLAVRNLIRKREIKFPHNLVRVEALAVLVSVVGIVSVIVNNTSDYAYATYFVSMTVWLSGAYTVCLLIKRVHSRLTIDRVTAYLAVVCAAQCLLALLIDSNVVIKSVVDTYIMQDQQFLNEIKRLYGIGASLDTAGVRFSACLILLMFVINKRKADMSNIGIMLSVVIYLWIAVVGNMMARTTIVGVALSMIYAIITFSPQRVSYSFFRILKAGLIVIILAVPICVYLYENSQQFYHLSRFAFEGFFNLIETGEWEIDSNERLKTMIAFPDNIKTWIIGDGYFENPYYTDPYYVGYQLGGYYMGTDIGYCRFIFYFGLTGLFAFVFFLASVARECVILMPKYKLLVIFILLLGFVVWLKVATDVFLVMALILCVGNMQEDTNKYEDSI